MRHAFCVVLVACCVAGTAAAETNETSNNAYDFLLAKMAAAEGHADDALALMAKVLAADPGNPVLMFEHASMLADAGRLDAAEAELRKTVAAKPDFYDAQRLLGRMLLDRAGNDRAKVEESLEHLRVAFKLYPDDLASGMAVTQILTSLGKPEEAEKVLAQMLERAPDQRALNYNYAQVLTKLGRGDESRQYLEKAVEVDPTFGPAILQLVDIYQKENEWAKAAALLQPLVGEDPMNLDLQRQQALFYLRAGQSEKALQEFRSISAADPKDSRSRFYVAEALSDLNQQDEAQKIYRSLLEQSPDEPEILGSYGISLMNQRKYDEAAAQFRTMLNVKDLPPNARALATTQLALVQLEKGSYASAYEMVQPVLVVNDLLNTQAVNISLEALRKQKKYAEGVKLLEPLVAKFPADPFIGARYVEMLVRSGQKEKAQQVAQGQIKLGTRNAIAAAEAFIQADDMASGIATAKEALAAKPADLDLQFTLASAYERSGDIANAEKSFLTILDQHPDHAPTLNYLGYMWAERGVNLARAADMLKKAVASDPRNGAYVDSLGWVYFQQGNLDLAEKYLRDASQLLPTDSTVQEHLGDVYAKRGDVTTALSMYKAALKLEPEARDEAKLRSKIADLERQAQNARR